MSKNNIHARIRASMGALEDRLYFAGHPRSARAVYETWRIVRRVMVRLDPRAHA